MEQQGYICECGNIYWKEQERCSECIEEISEYGFPLKVNAKNN